MRVLFVILGLAFALTASATPTVINDACFNKYTSGPNLNKACNALNVANHDVIGDMAKFDGQKIVINQFDFSWLDVSIFTNFGNNGTALNPFQVGDWLNIGDLMFGNNGVYEWGIVLQGRVKGEGTTNSRMNTDPNKKIAVNGETLVAGGFYKVNSGFEVDQKGLLKAKSVINNNVPTNFRPDAFVWLQQTDGSTSPGFQPTLSLLSTGTVTVNALNGNPHLRIDVRVPMANAQPFVKAAAYGVDVHWAVATCGNDVIDGLAASSVPEPGTIGMMGAGLIALGLAARRKFGK